MNEQRQLTPLDEVRRTLTSSGMRAEIKKALPEHVSVERFERVVITALQTSAARGMDLASMDRTSLWAACMRAAQAGLLPDGREGALVPFKGKVEFQPMVEGLMKQVRNSGELLNISVQIVKERDHFDYELGDNERIVHKPALKDRGETIGAYSIATLKGGEKSREWMDVDQMRAIRDRSPAWKHKGKDSPWGTDEDEMFRKTVFRRHYKRLPKSTDLDGMIHDEDEVFGIDPKPASAPPVEKDVTGQAEVQTDRPSRLQKVVDMEPAATEAAVEPPAPAAKVESPI